MLGRLILKMAAYISVSLMPAFEFAGFTLDLTQRRLRNGAGDVMLSPKPLALLSYFVTNPGRVIGKDELIGAVWPNVIVSDDSVSQCLRNIRATLGPAAEGLIRTVPRRGYLLDEAWLSASPVLSDAGQPEKIDNKPSLAILPFINMSGDPEQEFFADGVTEDIITDLSKVSGLSVIARGSVFSYKGKAADVAEIAARFHASHVLEGSVRKSGRRVRINAQLADALEGTQLWAERYDRDLADIFYLQDDIARNIVDALKVHLLARESEAISRIKTRSGAAYEFCLRGRHYLSFHSLKGYDSGYRMFMKAIELDPGYARAYAGAADCCTFRCMWNADISVEQALELSAKAVELDPKLPEAHAAHGWALAIAARYTQASQSFERAIELDPMSYEAHYLYARAYALQGSHTQSAHYFERAIAISPDDFQPYGNLSHQYWGLGRLEDSMAMERCCLERAERELELRPDNARALCYGSLSLAILGEAGKAREWAGRALWLDPDGTQVLYNVASLFSLLGDYAEAMELLERCLPRMHSQALTWAMNDKDLAPLHNDPRFLVVVEGMRASQ